MNLIKIALFLLSGIFFTLSNCSDSNTEKALVIKNFYESVKTHAINGVPNDSELAALSPYISKSLNVQLEKAYNKEKRIQNLAKEPEPPRFENCLFTSAFEGFSTVKGLRPDSSCSNCMLITFLLDAPDPSLKPIIWTDRVFLQKSHGRWVIDDIEYLFNCQFCPTGRLRLTLETFISE
jgi:hypothetical protein